MNTYTLVETIECPCCKQNHYDIVEYDFGKIDKTCRNCFYSNWWLYPKTYKDEFS